MGHLMDDDKIVHHPGRKDKVFFFLKLCESELCGLILWITRSQVLVVSAKTRGRDGMKMRTKMRTKMRMSGGQLGCCIVLL